MKKKVISIVLILCVLLSAMPVTVFAAESDTVTFTAIDGTAGNLGESYNNIFDGRNSPGVGNYTKWCVQDVTLGAPYVVIKASSAVILESYTFITGNDTASYSGRNPKAWTVYGSNDYSESAKTGTWTAVHTVTNGEMPAQNFARKTFSVSSATAYNYFKIVITEVASLNSNVLFQFCGIELIAEKPKEKITDYSVGETLEFGYYPQTEVTDESVRSALDSLAGVEYSASGTSAKPSSTSVVNGWTSYKYFSGTGSSDDGQMKPGDYMRYIDIVYNGGKYRGVVFDSYRPAYTSYDHDERTYQNVNGYKAGMVYWFKFEPITWRVLDPANGLVMSETILDSQAFNNYVIRSTDGEYYGDLPKIYANNYAESSIRKWLNDDFYNTAFSASQKDIIAATTIYNSAYRTSYSKYDSKATTDKVYLLSYSNLINEDYGFSLSYNEYDTDRRAEGSDYAKSQGLWVSASGDYVGKSSWRLRSAGGNSGVACEVGNGGNLNSACKTDNISSGTRPALNLNTSASIIQSEDNVANYTIETYKMNTSGTYVLTKSKLLGDVGESVKAKYTESTGFTLNEATSVLSGEIVSDGSLVLKVYLDRNKYILTTVGDGESNNTEYYYGQTVLPVDDPEKTGYEFDGWDKAFPETMPAENLTITAKWKDVTAPTGEITVGTSSWRTFINNITFGLFFKDTQEVTITANDNSGAAVTIEYLLSDKELTEAELASKTFTVYNNKFNINPNNEYVIYVKLTDTSGNVAEINTSGIVLDNIAPVISGVSNGATYCAAQTVTVSDKYDVTVTVNDEPVTLENGKFTLSTSYDSQRIVAKDQAGNVSAEITVTVNDGHTYEWYTENGKYWGVCRYCDHETAKNNIPEVTITGADKVCKTQNYTFIIAPSSGLTNVSYGYEFSMIGDNNITASFEDGVYSGTVLSNMYNTDTSFKVTASATTDDGYIVSTSKIVQILSQHTGGTGTCTEKAKCEVCGAEYGEIFSDAHTGEKVWTTKNATQHKQEWNCCGVTTVALENHEWENGVCKDCGYVCSHTGGTADCKHKAKCEACGAEYGNLNPDNHTGEKEWTTKNATQHEQEWNCCGVTTVALENHEWENGVCKDCGAVKVTPVTSLSFTLDMDTYAIGKNVVDLKVSGANTGILTIGVANSGYFDGYIVSKGEIKNYVTDLDATFSARTTYYVGVFLQVTQGYSLKNLTKENIKLNGTAATSLEVLTAETQAIAYFQLPQLSNAFTTSITGVDFALDGYTVGGKITESKLVVSVTPKGALTSQAQYITSGSTNAKITYILGTGYDESEKLMTGSVTDDSITFAASTTYYLGIVMIPEDGYSFDGLTKEDFKLGNITATECLFEGIMVGVIFKLPKLSANSINFTLDMNTYAVGKKIVDLKVSGANNGLLTIGGADTGYGNGFAVMLDDRTNDPISPTAVDTFSTDTSYVLRVKLSAQAGYSLADVSKITLNNTIVSYVWSSDGDYKNGFAYFMLPKLTTGLVNNITAIDFALDGYTVGSKVTESKLIMSVTPAGVMKSPVEYVNPDDAYANRLTATCFLIGTKNENAQGLLPLLDDNEEFETGITYYLNIIIVLEDGCSLDGLTKDDFKLGNSTASDFLVNGSIANVLFELPQLSANSVNFTLDMNTYAVGKKIVDLKVNGANNGLLTIGGADNGYYYGYAIADTELTNLVGKNSNKIFAADTTYYLCVALEAPEGYSLTGLTKENITLNNTITAFDMLIDSDNNAVGAAYFILPQLSADSVSYITAVNFTLGGYAVGSKVTESTLGMTVTPVGALTSSAEYVDMDDVLNGHYTTTFFAICTNYNDSSQTIEPIYEASATFAMGITYYLEVAMIPNEGYSFGGLTKENVKLGSMTAIDFSVAEDGRAYVRFKLPVPPDYSWYTNNKSATEFTVLTVSQLLGFADLVNGTNGQTATDFEGKTVKLGANLNLSDIANWIPIGMDRDHAFKGTFDGNGKTISNLTINSKADIVGLFGCVDSGTVKNLNVSGSVTGVTNYDAYIGGIVGAVIDGSVENCSFSGSVIGDGDCIGGIVGIIFGEISGCSNFASVGGNGYNVGGIAGCAENIRYCYNQGSVTSAGRNAAVGGIAGEIDDNYASVTVYSCYNTGALSATGNNSGVGGIVGYVYIDAGAVTIDKVYYLDSTAEQGIGEASSDAGEKLTDNSIAKTADEFASGEVAYLLQKGVSAVTVTDEDGNEVTTTPLVWGQKSSTDGSAPILTSNEDYRVLPVMDGEVVVNYSILKTGETNSDGVVDIYDYQNTVNIALSDNNLKTFSEKYDLNGDGVLDVLDISLAEQGGMSEAELSAFGEAVASADGMCYIKNADLDGDGVVDVLDISLLERLLAGHRLIIGE